MKIQLSKSLFATIGVLIFTAIAVHYFTLWNLESSGNSSKTTGSDEPLYWVAPMDPNYKRDKPGKSPMGMDLIPVYENQNSSAEAGAVTISPYVVNNLGVRTAQVIRGYLSPSVKTVGYVQYDEDRLVHIHPRVEGWIEKLHVNAAGDPVEDGAPLYEIYSPTLVNAQEELLLAQKRNNRLLIAAARERLSALQVTDSEIKRLENSGQVSQTVTIRAPQSGVLDQLMIREGMYVKPGMEMMSIGQLEHIWVIGEVFERQAMNVAEGDEVIMTLDYVPGRQWSGSVDYIYPSLNTKTRTTQVRVHFDNPDGYLRPGMFAQLEIATEPSEQALLIPREALIRTGTQNRVVVVLGEGQYKSIEVEVGQVADDVVEILSGLNEGDEIVSSAQFLIDSESSKSSDFKRMGQETESPDAVWAVARIESVHKGMPMVTASHEAIKAWDWTAMTMDFVVAKDVPMSSFRAGEKLEIRISRSGDNKYRITGVRPSKGRQLESMTQQDGSDMESDSHEEHNHD